MLSNNLSYINIERFVIEANEQGAGTLGMSRKLRPEKYSKSPSILRPILPEQWLCHADEAQQGRNSCPWLPLRG